MTWFTSQSLSVVGFGRSTHHPVPAGTEDLVSQTPLTGPSSSDLSVTSVQTGRKWEKGCTPTREVLGRKVHVFIIPSHPTPPTPTVYDETVPVRPILIITPIIIEEWRHIQNFWKEFYKSDGRVGTRVR